MSDIFNIVKNKAKQFNLENITLAQEKCRQADNCIMQAKAKGGDDKEAIMRALALYQESLELNSKQAQPYIGVAYIIYSSGDIKQAIGILNRAKEIEPYNLQITEMLNLFNTSLKESKEKKATNSLSTKIKKEKKSSSIFDKITQIFFNANSANKKSPKKVLHKTDDFAKMISETRKAMEKP